MNCTLKVNFRVGRFYVNTAVLKNFHSAIYWLCDVTVNLYASVSPLAKWKKDTNFLMTYVKHFAWHTVVILYLETLTIKYKRGKYQQW